MICWNNQINELAPSESIILSTESEVTLPFFLELFDVSDFESNNSEQKIYKIESFANEIQARRNREGEGGRG